MSSQHPNPYEQAPTQPDDGKSPMKLLRRFGPVAAASLFVGVIAGSAIGSSSAASAPASTVTATVSVTETHHPDTVTAPASTITRTVTVAPTPTQAPGPKSTFGSGTWSVGTDIAAGSYKVTKELPSSSFCYWAVLASPGSDNIIQNDVVTGGLPEVTIQAGQGFKSQDCGTWQILP